MTAAQLSIFDWQPEPALVATTLKHDDPATICHEIVADLRVAIADLETVGSMLAGEWSEPTAPDWLPPIVLEVLSEKREAQGADYWAPTHLIAIEATHAAKQTVTTAEAKAALEVLLAGGQIERLAYQDGGLGWRMAQDGSWLGDLTAAIEEQSKRAEASTAHLRRVHAQVLGCSAEELDERVAAEAPARKAERDASKPTAHIERAPAVRAARGRGKPKAEAGPALPPTKRLTDRQRELLADFKVESNVARYQREGHIDDWPTIKEILNLLGGKWQTGGKNKAGGFRFADDVDAAEVVRLAQASGEILDPRAAGFFPTPEGLALQLVSRLALSPGDLALEPSAGRGAIALAVRETWPGAVVECVELLPENRKALEALGFPLIGSDFMSLKPEPRFDAVAMNAPFHDRNDVHHTLRALDWLKPGGRLAAIASAGVAYRDDALGQRFRGEIAKHGGLCEENPMGSFLESGTGVSTVSIYLTKRGA